MQAFPLAQILQAFFDNPWDLVYSHHGLEHERILVNIVNLDTLFEHLGKLLFRLFFRFVVGNLRATSNGSF
jgi:hypothetical protein